MANLLVVGLFLIILFFVCWVAKVELKKMDNEKSKKKNLLARKSFYDKLATDKKFRENYLKNELKRIRQLERNMEDVKWLCR